MYQKLSKVRKAKARKAKKEGSTKKKINKQPPTEPSYISNANGAAASSDEPRQHDVTISTE